MDLFFTSVILQLLAKRKTMITYIFVTGITIRLGDMECMTE
jgi:hypothetical protein